jgi:hypothetical protein
MCTFGWPLRTRLSTNLRGTVDVAYIVQARSLDRTNYVACIVIKRLQGCLSLLIPTIHAIGLQISRWAYAILGTPLPVTDLDGARCQDQGTMLYRGLPRNSM